MAVVQIVAALPLDNHGGRRGRDRSRCRTAIHQLPHPSDQNDDAAKLAQIVCNAQYFVMRRLDWQHRYREGVYTAQPDRNGRVDTT